MKLYLVGTEPMKQGPHTIHFSYRKEENQEGQTVSVLDSVAFWDGVSVLDLDDVMAQYLVDQNLAVRAPGDEKPAQAPTQPAKAKDKE